MLSDNMVGLLKKIFASGSKEERYVVILLLNFLTLIFTFSNISGILPNRLDWVKESAIFISIIGSVVITLIIIILEVKEENIFRIDIAIMLGVVGFIVVVFFTAPLDQAVTRTDLDRALENASLSEVQRKQLERILEDRGYLTIVDINNAGLSTKQREEILALFASLVPPGGASTPYPTSDIDCYVTPVEEVLAITIRKEAHVDQRNKMGELVRGRSAKAIAHNGGTPDISRWWLIVFPDRGVLGWVSDAFTLENNELSCAALPKHVE